MNGIIQLTLTLLQAIIPQLSGANAALITKIINGLITLVPILVKEYQALVPMVQNIISVLKNNNQVTPDQWVQLDTLEAQVDAAFEAAAINAQTEDKI